MMGRVAVSNTHMTCQECGMTVPPLEYHPYAACLMFKACHDSATVRANLFAVMDYAETGKTEAEPEVVIDILNPALDDKIRRTLRALDIDGLWTRITDDPETWPLGRVVMVTALPGRPETTPQILWFSDRVDMKYWWHYAWRELIPGIDYPENPND